MGSSPVCSRIATGGRPGFRSQLFERSPTSARGAIRCLRPSFGCGEGAADLLRLPGLRRDFAGSSAGGQSVGAGCSGLSLRTPGAQCFVPDLRIGGGQRAGEWKTGQKQGIARQAGEASLATGHFGPRTEFVIRFKCRGDGKLKPKRHWCVTSPSPGMVPGPAFSTVMTTLFRVSGSVDLV